MIEIKNLSKTYGSLRALDNISLSVKDGSIFGLVGSNGAGKSSLLRLLAGIYLADEGAMLIDGSPVYENCDIKNQIFYIPDVPQFFGNASLNDMAQYYRGVYIGWSEEKFLQNIAIFSLDTNKKISRMSKGTQRQAAFSLAFAAMPKYLILDEVFDGLDPVMKKVLKEMTIDYAIEHNATVIIASHNLAELEKLCDCICLLHKGKTAFVQELDDLKQNYYCVQAVFQNEGDLEALQENLTMGQIKKHGLTIEFTAVGEKQMIYEAVIDKQPLIFELLPLSLEDIVIYNMEVMGYDVRTIIQ